MIERGDRIVVGARARSGEHLFKVLRLRDGRIVDIQDCRSRRHALRLAGATGQPQPPSADGAGGRA